MKIFTASQLSSIEHYTMEHEPIHPIDLMERAAMAVTQAITSEFGTHMPVVVFAGPGNNGGDALAVARLLAEKGYDVEVFLFNVTGKLSEECEFNWQRLRDNRRMKKYHEVTSEFDPPKLDVSTLVVDGLFGTGLKKPLAGGFAALVKYINQSAATVVSIDMPSGLMTEDNTYTVSANVVHADITLTFQYRKLAFMFADNQQYIGRLKVLDIRLSESKAESITTTSSILEESQVRALLQPRPDFAGKHQMGTALIIAGSYGMAGAAVLATRACLRTGVGKVVAHVPKRNYNVMQISVPEAIAQLDLEETKFSEAVDAQYYDAVGIGPGLGQAETTAIALVSQIRRTHVPMVIDADAINILANHQAWVQQLPRHIIFTPHPGEFDRLNGSVCGNDYERLTHALDMAQRMQAYILLKGHYSALCMPTGEVVFNSTGNAGMATAGSGDVLTGMITALLARGYTHAEACKLGMYLHGLAGDFAAKEKGMESLVASDIVDNIHKAFNRLNE